MFKRARCVIILARHFCCLSWAHPYGKMRAKQARHFPALLSLESGARLSHQPERSCAASRSRCTSRIGGTRDLAFVLPIKVGGVAIPHAIGRTRRVEVFAQHQTAGLLQPQPLLELQGAHRRDGLEVVMEPRDAHSQLARHLLDAQWLVEVLTESPDRSGDVRGVAPLDRQVTEAGSLLSSQEPVDNFPRDQRQENLRFSGGIQKAREAHEGV